MRVGSLIITKLAVHRSLIYKKLASSEFLYKLFVHTLEMIILNIIIKQRQVHLYNHLEIK